MRATKEQINNLVQAWLLMEYELEGPQGALVVGSPPACLFRGLSRRFRLCYLRPYSDTSVIGRSGHVWPGCSVRGGDSRRMSLWEILRDQQCRVFKGLRVSPPHESLMLSALFVNGLESTPADS